MGKLRATLSRFSEPQAVMLLLAWLRLLTTSLLLFFYWISGVLGFSMLQSLLDWKKIMIACVMILGLELYTIWARVKQISQSQLFIIIMLDIIAWSGLIVASGGGVNPAISYLLVLISIAALSLNSIQALAIMLLAVSLYAGIMSVQPMSVHQGHMLGWHLWGMWVLFLLDAIIMLAVITVLSRALREKDRAIAAYREETVRNEQLVSMGTLAASIAHELGTPLSTIGLILDDNDFDEKPLMEVQLERCREALKQLKNTSLQLTVTQRLNTTTLINQWKHECLLLHPKARLDCKDYARMDISVSPMFGQAILALLNNAVEAAASQVTLSIDKNDEFMTLEIKHDGKSIDEGLLKELGRQVVESSKHGLGLGYYLANASIERLGGQLRISNFEEGGVMTRVRFPLAVVQADYE